MDSELREFLEALKKGQEEIKERLSAVEKGLSETAEIASVFKQFGAMVENGESAGVPLLHPHE